MIPVALAVGVFSLGAGDLTGQVCRTNTPVVKQAGKVLRDMFRDNPFWSLERPAFLKARRSGRNFVLLVDDDGSFEATDWENYREVAASLQAVTSAYYASQPDDVHFVAIVTSFSTNLSGAFYQPLANDILGIGYKHEDFGFGNGVFDNTNGPLEGLLMLNDINLITSGEFGDFVFLQELAHRWGSFVQFDDNGRSSAEILGRDDAHWSYFFDQGYSPMEGNRWRDNDGPSWVDPPDGGLEGDAGETADEDAGFEDAGTDAGIQADAGRARHRFTTMTETADLVYSPLDLYTMGLARPNEVPPMLLIQEPDVTGRRDSWWQPITRSSPPQTRRAVTITGVPRKVTIDDIIRVEGERVPDSTTSRKSHRIGFVFVVRPSEVGDTSLLNAMGAAVTHMTTIFNVATLGRAALVTAASDTAIPPPKALGETCDSEADCAEASPVCTRPYRSVIRSLCSKLCMRDSDCGEGNCCGRAATGWSNACFPVGECYSPPDAGAAAVDAGPPYRPPSVTQPPTSQPPQPPADTFLEIPAGGCACGIGSGGARAGGGFSVVALFVGGALLIRRNWRRRRIV